MGRFHAEPYLADLRDFQRATVEHVTRRFYGPDPTTRFLVADETGLGKSLVARGVVARTIERLQDDPSVRRIDIVYLCGNAETAAANLGRLAVTADNSLVDKPVNLMSTVVQAPDATGGLRERLDRVTSAELTPQLVIVDGFARLHTLLGNTGDTAITAKSVRVLLLASTPYRPFTYPEERADDHRTGFDRTLAFLAEGCDSFSPETVATLLQQYRSAAVRGAPVGELRDQLRAALTRVMTRQERPARVETGMLAEHVWPVTPSTADLVDYAHPRADGVDRVVDPSIERWMSVPRKARLDPAGGAACQPIDLGNARMRELARQTTRQRWWQLLWLPPSLPYLRPDGPYAEPFAQRITKRLIFTGWTAAPTAIAALLSYEAQRQLVSGSAGPQPVPSASQVRAEPVPTPPATLALFWPSPRLARLADPRTLARWQPATGLEVGSIEQLVADRLRAQPQPPEAPDQVAKLALHAPGNIAWRALSRVAGPDVSASGHWRAAAMLAAGLRRLFRRPETVALLGQLCGDLDDSAAVLRYCAMGNLQAVLDEYLHHLTYAEGLRAGDDGALLRLATCARQAIMLEPTGYPAGTGPAGTGPAGTGTTRPGEITVEGRFAQRLGGDSDDARQSDLRRAFNSPFWPLVLATTSAEEEGVDLHWWCHAVVHWDIPANPVDVDQREGKVHGFAGHAVRRNIAAAHRAEIISSDVDDPWRAAYEIAASRRTDLDDFAPHWLYPGPAKIERHLLPYTFSRDSDRWDDARSARTLYRLALGQPRQSDLLRLLRQRGLDAEPDRLGEMAIDLSPPGSAARPA